MATLHSTSQRFVVNCCEATESLQLTPREAVNLVQLFVARVKTRNKAESCLIVQIAAGGLPQLMTWMCFVCFALLCFTKQLLAAFELFQCFLLVCVAGRGPRGQAAVTGSLSVVLTGRPNQTTAGFRVTRVKNAALGHSRANILVHSCPIRFPVGPFI